MKPMLTKTSYLSGLRCHRCLWLDRHKPELKPVLTEDGKKRIATGNEVGKLARLLFPGGIEITSDSPYDYEAMVKSTFSTMKSDASVIYEASFIYRDVYCAVDILVRDGKKWFIYEVKSTTDVEPHYIDDVAIQYWILSGSGLEISDASVIHIYKDYNRHGQIQPEKIFTIKSILSEVKNAQKNISLEIPAMKSVLANGKEPKQDIGMHCHNPDDCSFIDHCWMAVPENSVFDISGLFKKRKFALYSSGVILMGDIPDDFELAEGHRTQVDCFKSGNPVINKDELKSFLKTISFPCYYFDIETFAPAVPVFDNSRPYQRICFQYSLHYMKNENSELKHSEFLAEPKGDPRMSFLRSFLSATETNGCILVYNKSFEGSVLNELARDFPEYEKKIFERIGRMVDLAVPFRKKMYYTPKMSGSYSIKDVLPACIPNFDYKDLEIQDGLTASRLFEGLYSEKDESKIQSVLKSLKLYCGRDTEAMVRLHEFLQSKIQ